jgi:hypothetical protein
MPKGNEYAYGAGPGGGLGEKNGPISGPWGQAPYSIAPGDGASQKGGEPNGPFGQYKQSSSVLPIVGRDGMSASPQEGFGNLGSGGGIVTPMDNSASAMPGVRGSDGSGPTSGGGAKISTPMGSPWGDMVG